MKSVIALIVMTSLITPTVFAGTVNFDGTRPGEAPAGWMATQRRVRMTNEVSWCRFVPMDDHGCAVDRATLPFVPIQSRRWHN